MHGGLHYSEGIAGVFHRRCLLPADCYYRNLYLCNPCFSPNFFDVKTRKICCRKLEFGWVGNSVFVGFKWLDGVGIVIPEYKTYFIYYRAYRSFVAGV